MKIGRNILLIAAGIILASCSKESLMDQPVPQGISFSIDASLSSSNSKASDGRVVSWSKGDNMGFFSMDNGNIHFTNSHSSDNTRFTGTLPSQVNGEYVYAAYPYRTGASLGSDRNYTFTIPTMQVQESYVSDLSAYDYMIGCSDKRITKVDALSSMTFHKLMSQMDFVVANGTGEDITVYKVTMSENAGTQVFATSATMTMNPDRMDMSDYRVAAPSASSLSVKINNPSYISNSKSEVISITFFPVEVLSGTELEFTVETDKGIYKLIKVIGGSSQLNFQRGERYITPITLD